MVYAPKKNLVPLLAGKYGKLNNRSTQWHQQTNEGKTGLEAVRIRALKALRSVRCKTNLAAITRKAKHFSSNEEKEKWREDYVDWETAVARQQVEDTETAIQQQ